MQSPLFIGFVVFSVILGGASAGWAVGKRLPRHHANDETKGLVSVAMAVVGTVSALVLGLLISNANTSFIARSTEVTALSANIIRLDRMLRSYGPEANEAREMLRDYAVQKSADLFPANPKQLADVDNEATYELLVRVENMLLALRPADARQQWWLNQAMILAANVGNTRWILAQQEGQGTPKAFVCLVTFWLTLLFASFALFAPRNATSAMALVLCALAVSGAVEMILEFEQPFASLVRISPIPMRNAVAALDQ